jgi:hypothetical protein
VLEFVKEALDEIAFFVEVGVVGALDFAIALGGMTTSAPVWVSL